MLVVWMLACRMVESGDAGEEFGSDPFRTALPHPVELRDDRLGDHLIPAMDDPLVARISADADLGEFPLAVTFDGTGSDAAPGTRFEWTFGDGAIAAGEAATHTYVGEGNFEATLTVINDVTGALSESSVTIDVLPPACQVAEASLMWGHVDDPALSELSGIVASRLDPDAYWVHEDSGNSPVLTAIDMWGATLGTWDIPESMPDFEDLEATVDPETGVSMLFLGDIGNNGHDRGEVSVWVAEEPDPRSDGTLDPFRMGLDYPNWESLDSETLLVDPLTMDVYIVTKEYEGPSKLFVKRAPHEEGSFVLEDLGEMPVEITATAGDVSFDGTRIVVRDYSPTAYVWMRDGYRPLEDAFDQLPCEIEIHSEPQGEAVAFTLDGAGIVTLSEGGQEPLYYIEL